MWSGKRGEEEVAQTGIFLLLKESHWDILVVEGVTHWNILVVEGGTHWNILVVLHSVCL